MFNVGDMVVRVDRNNGDYARIGQIARVISVEHGGVNVAYDDVKGEYWADGFVALVSPPVNIGERVVAEITQNFEEQPSTVDLHNQFRDGLITSVELANKLLWEWESYKKSLFRSINQV